jgi:hypothetical protein
MPALGDKVKDTIVATVRGTGEIVNVVTETVSDTLTTALKGTGSVGRALSGAIADVASGVIEGTSQVGGDLGKATKGAVIGVLQGTKEVAVRPWKRSAPQYKILSRPRQRSGAMLAMLHARLWKASLRERRP